LKKGNVLNCSAMFANVVATYEHLSLVSFRGVSLYAMNSSDNFFVITYYYLLLFDNVVEKKKTNISWRG